MDIQTAFNTAALQLFSITGDEAKDLILKNYMSLEDRKDLHTLAFSLMSAAQ